MNGGRGWLNAGYVLILVDRQVFLEGVCLISLVTVHLWGGAQKETTLGLSLHPVGKRFITSVLSMNMRFRFSWQWTV